MCGENRLMKTVAEVESVSKFLGILWRPNDVGEVRIPRHNGRNATACGYFGDPEILVRAVDRWDGRASIYVSLNPVDPALLARANGRIDEYATRTTGDAEIVCRRWLFIDIDPVRPSGISSNREELSTALAVGERIRDYLKDARWPEPVICMSGNGCYLLYRVELPNTSASTTLVKNVLEALAGRFDTAEAQIDRSVYNPARLIGLIGTMKVKGDSTPNRPHRRSQLLSVPLELRVVTEAELNALVESEKAHSQNQIAATDGAATVPELLERAGISYREEQPDAARNRWWSVEDCPFHPGEDSYKCGVGQAEDGRYLGKCFHNRGLGKGWQDWKRALGLDVGGDPAGSLPVQARQHKGDQPSLGASEHPYLHTPREWPDPPGAVAFTGLPGRIVEAIAPHTEADPVAILFQGLAAFANAIGPEPHALVGATRHALKVFGVIVGDTAKARKGDGWNHVEQTFVHAEPEWVRSRVKSGLSSGEGLIWEVRDAIEKREAIKEKGRVVGYQDVVVDEGQADKRLLVVETEFARALLAMQRQGNTLSPVIRQAWDRDHLSTMTKNTPARSTGCHVSIVAHITVDELRRCLYEVEIANGLANRFWFVASRRSKLLPEPEPYMGHKVELLGEELRGTIEWARNVGEVRRHPEAAELWREVYGPLSEARQGLVGALLARSEAQVLRMAAIYALLDRSELVKVEHLASAVELWAYSERSVEYIFGDTLGDPVADTIARALKHYGRMTRSEIRDLFGRHESAGRIEAALRQLTAKGHVTMMTEETGGRPREMWAWRAQS
jgi:hypothetical protein